MVIFEKLILITDESHMVYMAASMATFLKEIGIGGGERGRSLKKIGEAAERCSKAIWGWSCIPGGGKGGDLDR